MTVFSSNGLKAYIGNDPVDTPTADLATTDFDGVTWLQISQLETIGVVGSEGQEIGYATHDDGRERTLKGTRKASTLEVGAYLDYSDPGQAKLLEAEGNNNNYPIRIVYNDAPVTGTSPTSSERLMIGLVMSVNEESGDPNNPLKVQASIAVNSNVVPVLAATGD
jgi:hypothetical protein